MDQIRKVTISLEKMNRLGDKFKEWSGEERLFTLEDMMSCDFAVGTLGEPIVVETSEDMEALLVESNVGKVYAYTGLSTEKFKSGGLYMVVDEVE